MMSHEIICCLHRKIKLELEEVKANYDIKMMEMKSLMQKEKCQLQEAYNDTVSKASTKVRSPVIIEIFM